VLPPGASIYLSKHARERTKERRIELGDIIDALNNPSQILYDLWNDVYIAVSIRGFAVVYAFRGNRVEILTVLGKREFEALKSKYNSKRYKLLV